MNNIFKEPYEPPSHQINKVSELKENIDTQLQILKDRLRNEFLSDLDEIDNVLKVTDALISDCYFLEEFKTNRYQNFSELQFCYQRLLLRKEASRLEYKIEELDKKSKEIDKKNTDTENTLKNIIGTLVALFLTFTLIPIAITAIERINARYILPFVMSIVFFGLIMISFIYVINKIKINGYAIALLIIFFVIVCALWWLSWIIDIGVIYNITP